MNQANKHCSFVHGEEKVDRDEDAVKIKGNNLGDLFEEGVMETGKNAFNHCALTLHLCDR